MPHGSPSAGKYILGGLGKGKKYAAKRERLAAVRAANAKSVVHREDKFLLQTERNKRQPCGTMQRHKPSANPGVAVLLFAAAHGALEDAAKAAGHGALEDAAKAAGHGALEDAAEVVVPRARKREEKRIAKATANQTAKDMEDAKAQEKAAANLTMHEQAYGHLASLGSNAFGHLALFLCVRAPVYVCNLNNGSAYSVTVTLTSSARHVHRMILSMLPVTL